MEHDENMYDKMQELLKDLNGNLNVLEQQVDINTQMEFFDMSHGYKKAGLVTDVFDKKDDLFSLSIPIEEKKILLVNLASIDRVEAYRTIEQYQMNPDAELQDWAILALQQSKMLMESSLLNENQVFISTGMGGKGSKLRYFVVFISRSKAALHDYQKKILKTEIEITAKKNNCDLERIAYTEWIITCNILIPIQVQFAHLFEEIIDASNLLGDFLDKNFIITNVKELSMEEIKDVLEKM